MVITCQHCGGNVLANLNRSDHIDPEAKCIQCSRVPEQPQAPLPFAIDDDEDEGEVVARWYAKSRDLQGIAAALGVSRQTVISRLRRAGVEIHRERQEAMG